jgi:hypothetical protein
MKLKDAIASFRFSSDDPAWSLPHTSIMEKSARRGAHLDLSHIGLSVEKHVHQTTNMLSSVLMIAVSENFLGELFIWFTK